ncbi:hypothetical protein H0H87_000879, partial [Tephrocybe sp. NHM501043]
MDLDPEHRQRNQHAANQMMHLWHQEQQADLELDFNDEDDLQQNNEPDINDNELDQIHAAFQDLIANLAAAGNDFQFQQELDEEPNNHDPAAHDPESEVEEQPPQPPPPQLQHIPPQPPPPQLLHIPPPQQQPVPPPNPAPPPQPQQQPVQ